MYPESLGGARKKDRMGCLQTARGMFSLSAGADFWQALAILGSHDDCLGS